MTNSEATTPVGEWECPDGFRWETTAEHLHRDMADGVFPKQSERRQVPVSAPAVVGEPAGWRTRNTIGGWVTAWGFRPINWTSAEPCYLSPTPSTASPDREEIVGVLRDARETILDLKNARWPECEDSDDDWTGSIDRLLAKLEGKS